MVTNQIMSSKIIVVNLGNNGEYFILLKKINSIV